MATRPLALGRARSLADRGAEPTPFALPAHHLVTHGVIVGMTGSGKTGLSLVLIEEALRSKVPVLMIDVKGDLPNLLLTFPTLAGPEIEPWIDAAAAARDGKTPAEVADGVAASWREGLRGSGLDAEDVAAFRAGIAPRIITPGTTAGEPLHVLSSLEAPGAAWDEDEEAAREAVSASISLLLRLVERDADPARSREHVMLAHLAELRLREGRPAGLVQLLADLDAPPMATIGALDVDAFLPPRDRKALAQDLNTLLASPTFATWRKGAALDVDAWLRPVEGKTPAVIVSVAHLDDAERALVLGLIFEQILAWVRGLPGTSDLRALIVFDEVFGFLPPHPLNPPTKRPLLALLKQARAFGVGVVLATQNPMDLDYKALSNAGAWFVGRLQTDADRERVVEGLAGTEGGAGGLDPSGLAATLKTLPPRTFFVRDVHQRPSAALVETRWSLSWLRGPLTRKELSRLARPLQTSSAAKATNVDPASAAKATVADATLVAKSTNIEASSIAKVAIADATIPAVRGAAITTTAPPARAAEIPVPAGWKVYFAHPPAGATAGFRYVPWVAASVVAHVRDARLGIAVTRTVAVTAPLGPDGRLDLTRAASLDPRRLALAPAPGGRFQALPEALTKKSAIQAAERALKDHVYRSLEVSVDVHRELGLVREDAEPAPAFAERCRVAAARRADAAHQEILGRWAPKLARLGDRLGSAQAKLAQAEAETNAAPGAVGAALLGLVSERHGRRAEAQRDRAESRAAKARAEVEGAEAALRAMTAERNAEGAALGRSVDDAVRGIEARRLSPRKTDLELAEIAVAWGVE